MLELCDFNFECVIYLLQNITLPQLKKLELVRIYGYQNDFFINPIHSLKEFSLHFYKYDNNIDMDLDNFLVNFPNLIVLNIDEISNLSNFRPNENCKNLRKLQINSFPAEYDISFLWKASQLPRLEEFHFFFGIEENFTFTNQFNISLVEFINLSTLEIDSSFLNGIQIKADRLRKFTVFCNGTFDYNFSDFPYLEELSLEYISSESLFSIFLRNSFEMKRLCKIYARLNVIIEDDFDCPPGPVNSSVLKIVIENRNCRRVKLNESFLVRFPNLNMVC